MRQLAGAVPQWICINIATLGVCALNRNAAGERIYLPNQTMPTSYHYICICYGYGDYSGHGPWLHPQQEDKYKPIKAHQPLYDLPVYSAAGDPRPCSSER